MKKVILLLLLVTYSRTCQPNCNDCSNSFCTACAQGYQLTTDLQCILSSIVGCSFYDSTGNCIGCQPTYQFGISTCQKSYDGCIQIEANLSCTVCASGKTLVNSTCIGVLNCAEGSINCTKCAEGFNLSNGVCVDQSASCMIADQHTGVCAMCNDGYSLIGYLCINLTVVVPNCYIYNNSGFCFVCKQGYILGKQQKYCAIPGNSVCQEFDQQGNCLSCTNKKLKLVNGSCIDIHCINGPPGNCQKCQVSYEIINGSCYLVDVNCQAMSTYSRCQTCKKGYFVNANGTCSKLPLNCEAANIISAACIKCLPGFTLNAQGNCIPPTPIPNCLKTNFVTNTCNYCRPNYYISGKRCEKVSSLCNGYNSVTGDCTNCKNDYINYGGKCIDPNCARSIGDKCIQCNPNFSPSPLTGLCRFYDPNCAQLTFLGCNSCVQGYYLDLIKCVPYPLFCTQVSDNLCTRCRTGWSLFNGQCVVLITNCQTYSYNNASLSICTSCVDGYELKNSLCVFNPNPPQTITTPTEIRDPNCVSYQDEVCIQCANRYYFFRFTCVPINPNCKDYRADGKCTSCYGGYFVSNGSCIINTKNCKAFNNGKCSSCYSGYFLNTSTNNCDQISSLCKTSNQTTGSCLQCFVGYSLVKGACLSFSRDPNCIGYANDKCSACSTRFYLKDDNTCNSISALCKTYNITNGNCLSCYPGYFLGNGSCLIGSDPNSDINCQFRDNSGRCLQCYSNYFLAANLSCLMVNPLCKSFNHTNGACLSCYPGYIIGGTNCIVANSNNSDANCVSFIGSVCSQCYAGFFVKSGVCTRINLLCKTYNSSNGWCLSCYPGYEVTSNGQCAIPQSYSLSVSDPYCLQRSGSKCIKCSTGYFPSSGVCQITNPLCKTIDLSNGYCLSCYQGYVIEGGNCIILQVVTFPFCQVVRNGICQRCIQGYYTETPYQCSPVSILCRDYDQNTGNCLSCIPGYFLQIGQCVYPASGFDQNCITYDISAFCSSCKPGYYLLNYFCTLIDPYCVAFDKGSQTCNQCGGGKVPDGSKCK